MAILDMQWMRLIDAYMNNMQGSVLQLCLSCTDPEREVKLCLSDATAD